MEQMKALYLEKRLLSTVYRLPSTTNECIHLPSSFVHSPPQYLKLAISLDSFFSTLHKLENLQKDEKTRLFVRVRIACIVAHTFGPRTTATCIETLSTATASTIN